MRRNLSGRLSPVKIKRSIREDSTVVRTRKYSRQVKRNQTCKKMVSQPGNKLKLKRNREEVRVDTEPTRMELFRKELSMEEKNPIRKIACGDSQSGKTTRSRKSRLESPRRRTFFLMLFRCCREYYIYCILQRSVEHTRDGGTRNILEPLPYIHNYWARGTDLRTPRVGEGRG